MALVLVGMPSMVVPIATSTSNAIRQFDDAFAITLYSPTLTSTTVQVMVEPTSTGSNWVVLQSGGTDVNIESLKGTVISPAAFLQMRIETGGAEAAARTFTVTKTILT